MFIKLDFTKAFDSINWTFLIEVLQSRGFPPTWISWIESILNTLHSRVVINGGQSEFFRHQRGLRQGDPLSPMLFNLAVDILQAMLSKAATTLQTSILTRIRHPFVAMQYADDTALIAAADPDTLITLKIVLRLFSKASGLRINYAKSSFVTINVTQEEQSMVGTILGCKQTEFPISYLGMLLTIRQPNRAQFMPLVEKIDRRLQGWKCKMLSRGGRLQLVKSVLSSIPIYFMACFRLPRWTIARINKVMRRFLWGKSGPENRSMPRLNWNNVCVPTCWGGG